MSDDANDDRLAYALRVKTALSIETLEDWLEANCHGRFAVHFEDMTEDRSKKELMVAFSDEADKDGFKTAYQRREIG